MSSKALARLLGAAVMACAATSGRLALAVDGVSFARQVQPVLVAKCQGCHQPSLRSGGLAVGSFAEFQKGGRHGAPFQAGKPDESLIVRHLSGAIEPRMPMGMDPLPDATVDLIRRWIAEGATDDSSGADPDPIPTEAPAYVAPPVITALAFSPDGKYLAVSGNHEIVLHRVDGSGARPGPGPESTPGSTIDARLAGRAERIHSIAFSPDGKLLAAVGGSPARFGEVQLWDAATRKLVRAAKVGTDTLFGASFSPDGKYLAFGGPDKTVRVFDVASFTELRRMENHSDWVFETAFSVDSQRLVSVSRDHFLKLSEVATGQFLENLNLLTKATFGGQGELYTLSRHPQKDVVAVGGDDRMPRIYTLHRPRAMKIDDDSCLLRELEVQPGPVQVVRFSPDGALLAVGGLFDAVSVYRADSGQKAATLGGHRGGIYALAWTSSGREIATAGFDGSVRIYDLESRKLLRSFVPVPVAVQSSSTGGSGR